MKQMNVRKSVFVIEGSHAGGMEDAIISLEHVVSVRQGGVVITPQGNFVTVILKMVDGTSLTVAGKLEDFE